VLIITGNFFNPHFVTCFRTSTPSTFRHPDIEEQKERFAAYPVLRLSLLEQIIQDFLAGFKRMISFTEPARFRFLLNERGMAVVLLGDENDDSFSITIPLSIFPVISTKNLLPIPSSDSTHRRRSVYPRFAW